MKEITKEMIPEGIVQIINTIGNVVLVTHTHPDGDALGSLFGCADFLESLGKNVLCFLEEPISPLYDFLPHGYPLCFDLDCLNEFVGRAGSDIMVLTLDCGDDDRMGKHKNEFLKIDPLIAIDHHKSHRNFGTLRWVEQNRSSTGEMAYELAVALGADISYNCAFNLYVAICTDTGSFRYDCTSPRTMRIAADLLEKGLKTDVIAQHLYDNFSVERLRLMELVLSTLVLTQSDYIAFIHVTKGMIDDSGGTTADLEGFIDFPRSIRSVKVAVFLKDAGDTISVSMRAKGECDVASIAKTFGGGGHRNAAGFRYPGTSVEQLRGELNDAISKALTL